VRFDGGLMRDVRVFAVDDTEHGCMDLGSALGQDHCPETLAIPAGQSGITDTSRLIERDRSSQADSMSTLQLSQPASSECRSRSR
jgi:hypothetical protein